jgi:hypothetical protein
MKTSSALILTLAAAAMVMAPPAGSVQAQGQSQNPGPPEWVTALRHDTSRPLKDMTPKPAVTTRSDFEVKKAMPEPQGGQTDQAVQSFFTSALAASPGIGFDGVGEGNPQFSYNVNSAPPDTTGEAGRTQYVQWVNTAFAVFDKATGSRLYGPAGGNTLWSGFGGNCETTNHGDPIVQYDQLADRWVMTQFSLVTGNYLQCVAVSQTSDALGPWHRYAFSYEHFPDYPKLAVWPTGYFITFNMFGTTGSSFTGGRVCAYDRAKMLAGQPASQVCFQSTAYPSPLPSDLEGQTLPPSGTPNYVLTRGSSTSLNLWKFTPNFASPASSTFTGPTSIPVSAYTTATARIPQPGTSQGLDTLGDRLMYRLGYRNLGTREALTVNHSVVAGTVTGVRWYELNITGGVPSVRQQATYAPDAHHRWMGSIAMDRVGNIAVGYTTSSSTVRPSIRFAGREATEPLNTMSTESSLQIGGGSQTTGLARWGDYSTMAIDPVDDCTFWYTSEYLRLNGTFNWSTRVGSFKFPSCTGDPDPPAPNFSLGATPASRTITQGQATTFDAAVTSVNGYTGGGSFSVTGLPANATASFSPTSYSGGSGTSTLTITTAANTPAGSSQLTITAADTSGTPAQSTIVTLTVNAVQVPDFTLTASPSSRNIKRGRSGTYTVTVTPSGGFNESVAFSLTGCPSNTTCTFSPGTVNGGGSSTLTIATTNSTPRNTYTLVITGTSASMTRSASVSLRVQ